MSVRPSASAVEEASRSKAPSPSGRLLLRMPPGLHAALARAAEREGTSLNGYIIARLTSSVGWVPAEAEDGSETAPAAGHPQRTLTWLLAANVAAVSLAAIAAIAILLAVWLA